MPMAEPVTATTGKNWAAIILGAVIAIIGLVLAIGGVWLAALGGSLYYVITGVAMMIAGWLLFRQQLLGGWLYIAIVTHCHLGILGSGSERMGACAPCHCPPGAAHRCVACNAVFDSRG